MRLTPGVHLNCLYHLGTDDLVVIIMILVICGQSINQFYQSTHDNHDLIKGPRSLG